MSRAIAWIRSRSCSRTAVGVRGGAGLGGESGPESAVCGAAIQCLCWMEHHCLVSQCCSSTEPFGRTKRPSLENVLLAISFFGLARSDFCVSGRLSSELADFAAVLLAASWTGRATLDPADCAATFLGITHSHCCSSSRYSTVRSFVPVLEAACTRQCRGEVDAAMLR